MESDYILLPQPRKLRWLSGECRLEGERFIRLGGRFTDDLLRTGRIVQEALAEAGASWQLTTSGGNTDPTGAIVLVDPTLMAHREGYLLTILPGQVRIVARDAAGAFYGAQTLKQLARQAAGTSSLPCVNIQDWPDFANRCADLDISRDRVPTMESLYMLVDMFAEWKVNQFQLYMEHTFAYRNHREVWANASPMTGEEILLLDRYCRERFIELVPQQNCLGHMERWLIHPDYQHLAEIPFDGELPPEGLEYSPGLSRLCRSTFCPTDPGTLELVDELFGELLPHFSSGQASATLDEPFDLGRGRTRQLCEEKGWARVYFEYILEVCKIIQKHGHSPRFWAWPVKAHPEWAPELPPEAIAHAGYPSPATQNRDYAKFADAGVPFFVDTVGSGVLSVAGQTDTAIEGARTAAEGGVDHGAIGFENHDWGDDGHGHTPPVTFLSYAYGAAVGWAGQANQNMDIPRALDKHVFRDAGGVMGRLAYDLGNVFQHPMLSVADGSSPTAAEADEQTHVALEAPPLGGDPLYKILHEWHALDEYDQERAITVEGLERTLAHIDGVMAPLSGARMARPDAALVADEFSIGAALQRHACHLGIARAETGDRSIGELSGARRKELAGQLGPIIDEYRRLWLLRSRPGGLDDSAGRLERLLAAYRA